MISLDIYFTINVLFVNDASSVPLESRHLYKSHLKRHRNWLYFWTASKCHYYSLSIAYREKEGAGISERDWEDFKVNSDRWYSKRRMLWPRQLSCLVGHHFAVQLKGILHRITTNCPSIRRAFSFYFSIFSSSHEHTLAYRLTS